MRNVYFLHTRFKFSCIESGIVHGVQDMFSSPEQNPSGRANEIYYDKSKGFKIYSESTVKFTIPF